MGTAGRTQRSVAALIRRCFQQSLIGLGSFALSISAFSNPVMNNVSAGQVSIQQSQSSTTITQTSQKGIINWRSFNIGGQESTHFQQPNGGVTLNRISPTQGASQIFGMLTATGRIILVNPAGVYFGPSAFVNVGSLIATTANITDQNFLNGIYKFEKVPGYSGVIQNEGTIIAAQNGLIALVAPGVINNGMIKANLGKVVLGSADAYTMTFEADNLISFQVDVATSSRGVDRNGNALPDGVKNVGTITADGGTVMVSAKAAAGVLDNVINMEGVTQAQSVSTQRGEIILSGDTTPASANVVRVAGKLNASGKNSGEKGGNVTITGTDILLDSGANIDVSGDAGGGNVFIGGNFRGAGPLPNATALVMLPGASINANAITSGDGGQVALWSDNYTNVSGSISATGGSQSGNGGYIETSGEIILDVGDLAINTGAPHGSAGLWLLDPAGSSISISTAANSTITGSSPFQTTTTATTSTLNSTTLTNALASGNATVQTSANGGSGTADITLDSSVGSTFGSLNWASGYTLTLLSVDKIFLNSNISAPNGGLVLNAANISQSITSGTFALPSTTGVTTTINVANFNITSGQWFQAYSSIALLPSFSATNFQLASGAAAGTASALASVQFVRAVGTSPNYTIADVYGLQGVETNLGLNYTLGQNIDASGTKNWNGGAGFVPIGSSAAGGFFTGTFSGSANNFAITGLYENSGTAFNMGLFGANSGTISNTIVINPTILSTNPAGGNFGGLVGVSDGALSLDASVNATISYIGPSTGSVNMGSLVGFAGTGGGTINQSFGTGAVSATFTGGSPSFINLGGLVGATLANITDSYSTASVAEAAQIIYALAVLLATLKGTARLQYNYSSGDECNSGWRNYRRICW